ncbi:MAG TPA: SUMF1/EgtB/PvdO family nonheme iron enzyme [Polyangiaceae bacterium]|nr:SUMF1/EgtB/PvdO family nonheme iron enzyme [Polyangiaceae bacterium]
MWRWLAFAGASVASIAVVTTLARRHSADPARCAALVAMGNRCCAEGQEQRDGTCVGRPLRCPPPFAVTDTGCVAPDERIIIAAGVLRVGAADWEAEGRVRAREIHVASFAIDAIEITEGAYAACVAAGRCGGEVASAGEPGRARGGITRAEAESYCAFQGGRLPTADEWTFAAAGPSARRYPWGDTGAVCRRASWGLSDGPCGFGHAGPELAGLHPQGATPEGVQDLAGNVSEWVAAGPDDPRGLVQGGSFSAQLATDLRTWRTVRWPAGTRSPEIGARCAYDLAVVAP